MTLRIHNESFWDISPDFVLDSRFRFGERPAVTKFVFRPPEAVLILGYGRDIPSHKALMSSYLDKTATDTTLWVRGIVLRAESIIYYRQGVRDLDWYRATTEMLRALGLPSRYTVQWGEEAKRRLKPQLEGYP
jgi:hypothetical protein